MAPILSQIESSMVDLISSMTETAYNFTWDAQGINQPDLAKVTFPCAKIYLEAEENIDEPDSPWSDSYFQEATFRIEVNARLDEETEVPLWEINAELNKALDDLKKLFGTNYHVSGNCDLIMYRGMEREEEPNGDIFIPKKMITRWLVRYSQSRTDVEEIAE